MILGYLLMVAIGLAALFFGLYRAECEGSKARSGFIDSLWLRISDLEADKRALMESLCRAEGRPFISAQPKVLAESPGWFDGQPEVVEKEKSGT